MEKKDVAVAGIALGTGLLIGASGSVTLCPTVRSRYTQTNRG